MYIVFNELIFFCLYVSFCFYVYRQWLPRNKLEPLGITDELDQIKLTESRKPADRKAVRKAYQEAMAHRVQTQPDKSEPVSESNTAMDVE